jgi:hypothetical protein
MGRLFSVPLLKFCPTVRHIERLLRAAGRLEVVEAAQAASDRLYRSLLNGA